MTSPRRASFLLYPDPRLKSVAAPVENIDQQIRDIWQEMLNAMYTMPGVGLAAPQIGYALRLAVLDCSAAHNAPVRLANPVILHASAKMRDHEEASPNLPGISATVTRPRAVTVQYTDETGTQVERDFVNLWATSIQHQIDHLDGKLFVDRLKPVKRRMLLARHAKNMKRSRK